MRPSYTSKRFTATMGLVGLCVWATQVWAQEVVWHCSKHNTLELEGDTHTNATPDAASFELSSFQTTTIHISLPILSELYRGRAFRIDNQPLTACFVQGLNPLSQAAFTNLGLAWSPMQLMARAQSAEHLVMLRDESQMQSCIVNNFPAVGYLSHTVRNDELGPCFE